VPAGVTSIKVKVLGPGGNGGLGSNYFVSGAPGAGAGGGGGGGAYAEKIITIPAGTTSYQVVVGTSGTASSFAGTLVVAGSGANAANASGQGGGAGGVGGTASGSSGLDVSVSGLTGDPGGSGSYVQCSGGYSLSGNGGNGANGIRGVGLGSSGGGLGGVGAGCPNTAVVGTTGSSAGAGGGGASGYQTTGIASGAAGKVVIEYGGNLASTITSTVLTAWPDAIICGNRVQYLELIDRAAGIRYRALDGAYTIFNGSTGAFINNYVGSTCPSLNVLVQQQKAN
jgi:hypothetical protein